MCDKISENVGEDRNTSIFFGEELVNSDQSLRGLTGLKNLGNTCYLNSALQALSNCPPFREYFRCCLFNDELSPDASAEFFRKRNPVVSYAFKDLMCRVWAENQVSSVAPMNLLIKVREKCSQFRTYAQQDSQEFIRCFLDVLHQELRRPVKKWEVDFMNTCNNDVTSSGDSANSPSTSGTLPNRLAEVSSQDTVENDQENFETADSGLSSETDESPKTSFDYAVGDTGKKSGREKIVGYRSVITDIFDGELVSSVKCQTCQHISYTNENFQDISLSIPTSEQMDYLRDTSSLSSSACNSQNLQQHTDVASVTNVNSAQLIKSSYGYFYWFLTFAARWLLTPWYNWFNGFYRFMFTSSITLEHCLRAFFSMDFLHGDDMYSCEKCSKLRNGVKQCELTKLPEILCIHLKRFRHDNMYNSKIHTRVNFPLQDLDLRPFVKESVLEKEDLITEYDLVAVVSHRGGSVDFGHYIAYCRNQFDNNWYEFDDSIVTRVNALEVMSREAYMLFYQKKSTNAMAFSRKHYKSLMKQTLIEEIPLEKRFFIASEWIHKFMMFSEPGSINNCGLLCSHGCITPHKSEDLLHHSYILSENTWNFLHARMGGGPPISGASLVICGKCKRAQNRMMKRRYFERDTLMKLSSHDKYEGALLSNVISKHWMECWKSFVYQSESEPPPAINNEALVRRYKDSYRLRTGAKYYTINREMWLFLQSIYGGGPELLDTPCNQLSSEEITKHCEMLDAKREAEEMDRLAVGVESASNAKSSVEESMNSKIDDKKESMEEEILLDVGSSLQDNSADKDIDAKEGIAQRKEDKDISKDQYLTYENDIDMEE